MKLKFHLMRISRRLYQDRRFVLLVVLNAVSVFFYLKFQDTGHFAGKYFRIYSNLEFFLSFVGVFIFFKYRFFAAAFFGIVLSRSFQILSGLEGHSTVFPFFSGISAAVLVKNLFLSETSEVDLNLNRNERFLNLSFLLFLVFLVIRSFAENFTIELKPFSFQDREVSPGVSANLAVHHTLALALNFIGPLLWIYTEQLFSSKEEAKNDRRYQIISGFSAGMMLSIGILVIQAVNLHYGISRLFIGTGRSFSEGRLPGLFSDSGASSAFLPVGIFILYLFMHLRKIKYYVNFSENARFYLLALLLLAFSYKQGRGYLLTAGFIFSVSLYLHLKKKYEDRKIDLRSLFYISVFFLIFSTAGFYYLSQYSVGLIKLKIEFNWAMLAFSNGEYYKALNAFDFSNVRTLLFAAGLKIFSENPFTGTGLNSFVKESAFLRGTGFSKNLIERGYWSNMQTDIPHDNPANVYIGAASDLGIIGILLIGLLFYLTAAMIIDMKKKSLFDLEMSLVPMFIFIPFLFGYHIAHPEAAVFLLLPVWALSWKLPGRRILYAAMFLIVLYMILSIVRLVLF